MNNPLYQQELTTEDYVELKLDLAEYLAAGNGSTVGAELQGLLDEIELELSKRYN